MNRVSDEEYASQSHPPEIPSGGGFDYRRAWREPQGIGVGAAVALSAGAGLVTFIIMRRRARARMDRLAWLALRAALLRSLLPRATRGAGVLGTVGGGLAAAAILQDRVRHGHSHTAIEDLNARLAALQAEAQARIPTDRPRPRDLAMGAVAGLVLGGIISRIGSGRKAN